jgi:glutathione synthase/RimK-type ligase-like ATP-grasp enzyme
MHILIVVNDPEDWTLSIEGVELVGARSYLAEPRYTTMRQVRVFNLCRSYRYQSVGYYVSLLAEARGHKPSPSVATIQDMKLPTLARLYTDELEDLIQEALAPIRSGQFTLSIYFGANMAKRYERLSLHLFNLFPAPLLRAHFKKEEEGWRMTHVAPIPASDIPSSHNTFVALAATRFFSRHPKRVRREQLRYALAILATQDDENKPSNDRAIDKFIRAARSLSIEAEVICRSDMGRLAEFDALFIRDTTAVNHYTYRFSRRAAAEGLAVLDDPDSILRCTNKVYLAQLLERHRLPAPPTMIVHRDNIDDIVPTLGLPVVLKAPDSSFSMGVVKVKSQQELEPTVLRLLEKSELIVAQKFMPTDFDWRVGVLDGKPLFVCKYHMAKDHWQIVKVDGKGESNYGKIQTMAVEDAPKNVVDSAVRAAGLIGDGLYGVDLKQSAGRCYVIEVNDNPNIDAGFEDQVLKDKLYLRIMESFLRRIEKR